MINLYEQKKRGFTLIEMMVAVTIFSIVMVISLGAILTIVDGNKKNQTMQVAINNLNYAVESMTRAIKTGYNYNVGGVGGCNSSVRLRINEDQNGDGDDEVTYSRVQFGNGNDNYGLYIDHADANYNGYITAPDLNITELCFHEAVDDFQPALGIVIQGETTGSKESLKTTFKLYTSVTQRQVQYD